MYDKADPPVVPLLVLQYVPGVLTSPLNIVPPPAVTNGELPGKSTFSPSEASPEVSQSVAPSSPEEETRVMPSALACWNRVLRVLRLDALFRLSQRP
jgi:hypothetical protein